MKYPVQDSKYNYADNVKIIASDRYLIILAMAGENSIIYAVNILIPQRVCTIKGIDIHSLCGVFIFT